MWEGSYSGAEKECEVEAAAETKCYGLAMSPMPYFLAQLMVRGRTVRNKRN